MIKAMTRFVHRALCWVGIHAPEQVFLFDDKKDDFVPDGHFCAVCSKTWEVKGC